MRLNVWKRGASAARRSPIGGGCTMWRRGWRALTVAVDDAGTPVRCAAAWPPEPVFVLFSELGESAQRMVAVFSGWRAFRVAFANNAAADDRPSLEKTVEESWLRLLFVPRGGLTRTDRAVRTRLGLPVEGVAEFPVFYSQRVGYYPDRLNDAEVIELQTVLYQAYGMAMRIEANPGLTQERLPQTFFVRVQDDGGQWRDAWIDEPPFSDDGIDVSIDLARVRRIAGFSGNGGVLQADLVLTPLRAKTRGSHRVEAIFTLLLMNRETQEIVCCEALQALEGIDAMWARVPASCARYRATRRHAPRSRCVPSGCSTCCGPSECCRSSSGGARNWRRSKGYANRGRVAVTMKLAKRFNGAER